MPVLVFKKNLQLWLGGVGEGLKPYPEGVLVGQTCKTVGEAASLYQRLMPLP